MTTLSTIGYEGASLEDFVATLQLAEVQTVLDIRELPISRRKGFAKTALSNALSEVGIGYVHLKGLGDPKEGREAARANDFKKFLKIYSKHLQSTEAQRDLELAVNASQAGRSCLLCYERDPNLCHRKLVAESISAIVDAKISHLGVKDGAASKRRLSKGTRGCSGKSAASRG